MQVRIEDDILVLAGQFDGRSTAEVRDALYGTLGVEDHDVVVDLSAVESVDLTALRVLVVASRTAAQHGHHVLLRGASPTVCRLLHLSRLRQFVRVERYAAIA